VDNDDDNKEKTEERIQKGCRKRTKAKQQTSQLNVSNFVRLMRHLAVGDRV